jgi:DNA-binding MarR family transcriptional regulator
LSRLRKLRAEPSAAVVDRGARRRDATAQTPSPKTAARPVARTAADDAAGGAYGVVEPLSVIIRWSRLRFYERIAEFANLRIDRSAISILDMLARHGPLRTSELADRLGLDRSTISRQVTAAMESGYIEKSSDVRDGRAALVSLSDEGKRIRQVLAHAWHSIAMELVADWTYKDQTEAGRLLAKLAERMTDDYRS